MHPYLQHTLVMRRSCRNTRRIFDNIWKQRTSFKCTSNTWKSKLWTTKRSPRRRLRSSRTCFKSRSTHWNFSYLDAKNSLMIYRKKIKSWAQRWKRRGRSFTKQSRRRLSFGKPWTHIKQVLPKLRSLLSFVSIPRLVTLQSKQISLNPESRTTIAKEGFWAANKIPYTIEVVMLYTIAPRNI